jgi:RNA-directed DNA polymerase
MENRLMDYAKNQKGRKAENQKNLSFVRYADDFVVIHKDVNVIKECQYILMEWLYDMGLGLHPSKTRISHTLIETHLERTINQKLDWEEINQGFNFLGFNVRQYPVGKYQSGKNNGKLLGFKTLIKPSKEAIKRHYKRLCEVIDRHRGKKQVILIKNLNPIIKGWCNYYSTSISKEVFKKLDHLLYWKLTKWGKRRHPNKTGKFVAKKYFHKIGDRNWVFASKMKDGKFFELLSHAYTPIVKHIKVKGNASPYNGDLIYWSTRLGRNPEMPHKTATLLKRQKGKCTHCELNFKYGDLLEHDHIEPLSLGGSKSINNQQLLHRHCHDKKTRNDGSLSNNKSKPIIKRFPENYEWINDILILVY